MLINIHKTVETLSIKKNFYWFQFFNYLIDIKVSILSFIKFNFYSNVNSNSIYINNLFIFELEIENKVWNISHHSQPNVINNI